jgi:hypothetical protein
MKNTTNPQITSTTLNNVASEHFDWTLDDINELMLGMVVTALTEVKDRRKSLNMRREAKEWLMSDDTCSPFSALNCCQTLGLDLFRLRNLSNTLMNGDLYNDF